MIRRPQTPVHPIQTLQERPDARREITIITPIAAFLLLSRNGNNA